MRSFLSKFLEADKIDEIVSAYRAKNSGAEDLPIYIPKSRFDDKNAKLTEAEGKITEIENQLKAAQEQLKAVPENWKQQLDDAKAALETQKIEYEGKLTAAVAEADRTAKIYGSGARNAKAVRALLDDTKPIDEQLEALKKSDSYLFNTRGLGKGTGKSSEEEDTGSKEKLTTEAMYRAVGLVPPQN